MTSLKELNLNPVLSSQPLLRSASSLISDAIALATATCDLSLGRSLLFVVVTRAGSAHPLDRTASAPCGVAEHTASTSVS